MFSGERVSSMAGNGGRKGGGRGKKGGDSARGGSGRGNPSFLSPCLASFRRSSFLSRCDFSRWFVSQLDARPDENLEMGISKALPVKSLKSSKTRAFENFSKFFFFFL